MIDIAIIGSGPAGLSAAINAFARGRNAVVFGRDESTSWLYKAENVNNHLGMPNITGAAMLEKFHAHARELDMEIREGRVLQVLPMGDYFGINFENEFIEARTVVIASGMAKGKKVPGEEDYLGKGVSYCATCDGMLYRGKDVVVVGEIKEGEGDAEFLAGIANKVYYVPGYKDFDGRLNEKIQIATGKVKEVSGETVVEQITLDTGETLACNGVFFVKESTPPDSLINGIEIKDNAIVVDRYMQTSVPGIFAAGDCTGWPFQVSNAVGEGLIAAQQADRYLRNLDRSRQE